MVVAEYKNIRPVVFSVGAVARIGGVKNVTKVLLVRMAFAAPASCLYFETELLGGSGDGCIMCMMVVVRC